MTITLRLLKGTPLTHAELDGNFEDLNGRFPIQTVNIGNGQVTSSKLASDVLAWGAITGTLSSQADLMAALAIGVTQTAPAAVDSISTITLNSDTDLVIATEVPLEEPPSELRIVDPATVRAIYVLNDLDGNLIVADGAGTLIIAALASKHIGWLRWDGAAWTHVATLAAAAHTHVLANLTDAGAFGRQLAATADQAAALLLLGVPPQFDPVETSATSITIDDTVANQDLISSDAAGPVTVTLSNSTSDNQFGAVTESDQIITVEPAANVQYYLQGIDDLAAAGRTDSFEVRGSITWILFRIDAGNRRYMIKGGTNHDQDLRGQVITSAVMPLADDEETASFTLALAHGQQKMLRCNHATVGITATIPANSAVAFPVGTVLNFTQWGAAALTIAPDSGVTMNKPSDKTGVLRAQYSVASLWKQDTDTWLLFGDLTDA